MNSKNFLPFEFVEFPHNYDKYVTEKPLADGVKNGFVTTTTTTIVVIVTDDFSADNYTRFVIYNAGGNGPFGSGRVDSNNNVEIMLPSPLTKGVSYVIYATDDDDSVNAPTIILPATPE